MTMAEPERGSRKTPLKKQPEIEEAEEGDEENGSPNSDKSDTTITPGIETPVAQSASGSPDSETAEEQSQGGSDKCEPTSRTMNPQHKTKLHRENALCEDMSPPPEIITVMYSPEEQVSSSIRRLEKTGSHSSEADTPHSLSREGSFDTQYKDSTGIDLEEFIKKTLNKSVKDRKMILQLARDLKKFIKEPKHQFLQFAEMSSYDRMLVHRIAAFFGLDHNVDQSGKAVIVSKTKITRIPDFSFEDHIQKGVDSQLRRKILPRKAPSLDEKESKGFDRHTFGNNRAKSLEERQKSYEEAKARIFKNGESFQGNPDDFLNCTPISVNRSGNTSLMSSKEDLGSRQPSTDSGSSGYGSCGDQLQTTTKHQRLTMQKANSYGGQGNTGLRLPQASASLSKADSVGSGNSGSFDCGSGRPYPVPTSPPGSHSDHSPLSRSSSRDPTQSPIISSASIPGCSQNSTYAFLVAMEPNNIPPGSVIVNPQTLQPHVNPDGSFYRYDPNQPPPWLAGGSGSSSSNILNNTSSHQSATSSSFPNNVPTQYPGDPEALCHRFQTLSFSHPSQDIIESSQQTGSAPQTPQGSHMVMGSAPYPSQPPYIQQPYYTGPQGVTGQPVRYTYQVPYMGHQGQNQGSAEGQSQPHSSLPHIGQYSQPFVQNFPVAANYPNVVVQQSGSQSTDMSSSNVSQTSSVFTSGPHAGTPSDNSVPSYSIQYGAGTVYSQNSYGPAQSPVFYSVPSTSPQVGYSFAGPGGTAAIRPTTPPSQGNNIPSNPSIAINMGQPVNFQQASGSGHAATSPQYGTYPLYPQVHQHQQAAAMRPVNQVVQIPGVQSHAQVTPGPSPQQPFSIVRPSMQVSSLPPQAAGSIGQHAMSFKGYSLATCFQKQTSDCSKDAGPSPSMLPSNLGHMTGHMAGSGIRPQQIGTGDIRMLGPTFRPQLQPLQFGQRTSTQQPPTPQQSSKPRE